MRELTGMACQELVEVITAHLDGTMDAVDRHRLEGHLAECPGCRTYLEQMRTTVRLTGMLPPETLPPSRRQGLLDAYRGWRRGRDLIPAAERGAWSPPMTPGC